MYDINIYWAYYTLLKTCKGLQISQNNGTQISFLRWERMRDLPRIYPPAYYSRTGLRGRSHDSNGVLLLVQLWRMSDLPRIYPPAYYSRTDLRGRSHDSNGVLSLVQLWRMSDLPRIYPPAYQSRTGLRGKSHGSNGLLSLVQLWVHIFNHRWQAERMFYTISCKVTILLVCQKNSNFFSS